MKLFKALKDTGKHWFQTARNALKRWFVAVLRKTPVLHGLPDCSAEHHRETIREMGTALPFSLAPIWVSALILIRTKSPSPSVLQSFSDVLGQGELYMYATSTLGPIFYLIHKKRTKHDETFPGALGHVVVVALLMCLSVIEFILLRLFPITDPAGKEAVFRLSLGAYVVSLILLYLAAVYDRSISPDPRIATKMAEDGFNKAFRDHRK